MNRDEIINYVSSSSRSSVCIYRYPIKNFSLLIMSIYFSGQHPNYVLSFEFDPIDLVDQGEGWIWKSEATDIDTLIEKLESYFSKKIDLWENVTRTAKLLDFDGHIDNERYLEEELAFTQELHLGKRLLPNNIDWVIDPNI